MNDYAENKVLLTDEEMQRAIPELPRWPIYLQAICAVILFSCSSYYHNFSCVSEEQMHALRRFDLGGICIMIMGSTTPPFYYGLMCEELKVQKYIIIGYSYTSCLWALYMALRPSQKDFKNNSVLAKVFIFAGLSCVPGFLYILFWLD